MEKAKEVIEAIIKDKQELENRITTLLDDFRIKNGLSEISSCSFTHTVYSESGETLLKKVSTEVVVKI